MTLLATEGFDWIDDSITASNLTTLGSRKWASQNLLPGTDAITIPGIGGNGRAILFRDTDQWIRLRLNSTPVATDEIGIAFWCKRVALDTHASQGDIFFGIIDGGGSFYHTNIRARSNSKIGLYRGAVFIKELDFIIPNNEWVHYALKAVINNTTGSYEIKINGVTIDSDTNVDTRNDSGTATAGFVQFQGFASQPRQTAYDNVVAWDDNGSGLTDFPGLALVRTIHPDGDGDDEDWTLSAGTNSAALVDETAPHDDDTTYIQDTVSTNRTLFTYDNVDAHTTYHGVQINSVVRETDASNFTLVNTFKQGGNLYPQSAQAIAGTSYENLFDILDLDPDTSAAWTESGLNALQAGVEVG